MKRGCKLEREEGIATRGLPEPDQGRPGKPRVEASAQQLVDRTEAQPADVNRSQSPLGHGAAKPRRYVAANRDQGRDLLTIQTSERVAKRRKRRCVDPLDVVDRQTDGTVRGEDSQRSQKGRGHRPLIGMDLRLAEQQRRFERAPLDRRQLRKNLARGIAEKIGQPREREVRLGL